MGVVTDLGALLNTKADKNFYTQQLMFWTAKYEANAEKLEQQEKYASKFESAFDDAQNADKKCVIGTVVWKDKDKVLTDAQADRYAHAKVKQYDEEQSEKYAELDIEYDAIKTMYETMIAQLDATEESEKSLTQKDAANTNLLQG